MTLIRVEQDWGTPPVFTALNGLRNSTNIAAKANAMTTTTTEATYRGIVRMPDGTKGTFDISNVPSVAAACAALKNESGAKVALILVPKETHIKPKSGSTGPQEVA